MKKEESKKNFMSVLKELTDEECEVIVCRILKEPEYVFGGPYNKKAKDSGLRQLICDRCYKNKQFKNEVEEYISQQGHFTSVEVDMSHLVMTYC